MSWQLPNAKRGEHTNSSRLRRSTTYSSLFLSSQYDRTIGAIPLNLHFILFLLIPYQFLLSFCETLKGRSSFLFSQTDKISLPNLNQQIRNEANSSYIAGMLMKISWMYSDFFTNCKSTANQLTELDNDLFYCFVLFGANKRGRILDEIHFSELQTTKLKNILTSK